MIYRFKKVADGLYRGSSPSPKDVAYLHKNYGIKKIVSLDAHAGARINIACTILGINHVIIPIHMDSVNKSLIKLFKHNFKKTFLDGGPVFVHCEAGKDRTGLVIGLLECKFFGEDPEKVIADDKRLGFGIDVDPKTIKLFEKLIRSCKSNSDINNADIVSNEREYVSDNRDSFLDEGRQGSFAPYISETIQYPVDNVYNEINDQSQTRENYNSIIQHKDEVRDTIPMVGIYNNGAGIEGAGPTLNPGGFIND
jgi:protein tyrosine phosphatase (PTP) superfamily phosphohydrolase (DUF442 family)